MSQAYITIENDMIDNIAFKIYGEESLIALLLNANPGLVDQPILLPAGLQIMLPDEPEKSVENEIINIWS